MLEVSNADIALLNSGTLRSDKIHPKGDFKLRDLLTILPLVDLLIVIQVKGKFIKFIEGAIVIYNYLCNQCLSPLTLWVWIPLRQGVHDTTKFVSDLQQVSGFLHVLRFPPSIKLTQDISEILLKVVLNTRTLHL
jgi:hypothetical protein